MKDFILTLKGIDGILFLELMSSSWMLTYYLHKHMVEL